VYIHSTQVSNATMQFPNAILPKLHSACAKTATIS
jgi:hypothetical protein